MDRSLRSRILLLNLLSAGAALLLAVLGLSEAPVVVELNGAIVRRAEQAATPLCDADRMEIVRLVAGG